VVRDPSVNFLCARPGFPKDSPSNLAWLPEKATADADAFLLTAKLPADAPTPKLRVILQGDGQRDVLCGGPWC
jgi:hypothetical protein